MIFKRKLAQHIYVRCPSLLCNSKTRPPSHFLLSGCLFPLYSAQHTQPHTLKCNDSNKAVTTLPQEETGDNRLPPEFCSYSIKSRWCPVVNHKQNVRKPSFCKLTIEIPTKKPSGQRFVMPFVSSTNILVSFQFEDQCRQIIDLGSIIIKFFQISDTSPYYTIRVGLPTIYRHVCSFILQIKTQKTVLVP